MFSRFKIFQRFSELRPQSLKISKMAQKIDLMNKAMNQTSPKIFSIFFILSTIPTFYFMNKVITQPYNSDQFVDCANANLKYINCKNILFYACIFTLGRLKFHSPTAKFTLEKRGLLGRVAPFALSLISLALPESDSKYIVIPTFLGDLSMVFLESQMTNYGVYPFWMYSYRHYIRFFDWITLIIAFVAFNKMHKRMKSHPNQFTTVQKKNNAKQLNNSTNVD